MIMNECYVYTYYNTQDLNSLNFNIEQERLWWFSLQNPPIHPISRLNMIRRKWQRQNHSNVQTKPKSHSYQRATIYNNNWWKFCCRNVAVSAHRHPPTRQLPVTVERSINPAKGATKKCSDKERTTITMTVATTKMK